MNETLIDDAYAEKAEREETQDRNPQRENLTDLSERGTRSGLPLASPEKVPAGLGFDAQPWDLGDDHGTGHDRSDGPRGRYRPCTGIVELTSDGHGFDVQRFSNPDLPEYCMFCGDRLVPPCEEWPCECAPGDPSTVPTFRPDLDCRCNGCERRRIGVRKPGGQRKQCGSEDCQRQYNRRKQKIQRDRKVSKDRRAAWDVIRLRPDRSDKDVAQELGIPLKRVSEARTKTYR